MKTSKLTVVLLLAFCFCLSKESHARKLAFGEDQRVQRIQDIDLTGPDGEELYLARLISTYFVGLGVNIRDDGFVIGVKGKSKTYYPMPSDSEVYELQKEGLLPAPLPHFELSLIDYLFGYSLYILLIGSCLYYAVKSYFSRRTSFSIKNIFGKKENS